MADEKTGRTGTPVLSVRDLQVAYGHALALQGVSFDLQSGILGIVGRNGMGKTTLCNTLMGLVSHKSGSARFKGREMLGLRPNRVVGLGVGYVPQGRRVWPSLSVDEHLRLAARSGRRGAWTVDRVYETFPRLTERRRNGGAQLSGGEQQMLAIGRALLANPDLLIMDEPTEGLAPVIVQQLAGLLKDLGEGGEISVLLIEQNLGVALDVSERIAIMMNGQIVRDMSAAELAADKALQQQLLGVGRQEDSLDPLESDDPGVDTGEGAADEPMVFRVRRETSESDEGPAPAYVASGAPTRWSSGDPTPGGWRPSSRGSGERPADAATITPTGTTWDSDRPADIPQVSVADMVAHVAYVAGTFDTKGQELRFIENRLKRMGLRTRTVDLSTSGRPSSADVGPTEVARYHPGGAQAVFTSDRGSAVSAMAEAFERYLPTRRDVGGIISAGGSGGTALVTPAMQRLPIGIPKMMVSTVASGDVQRYVGASDISMMYSVTDVQGINRISEQVLANAAHALGGMISHIGRQQNTARKAAIGLTMFGVTTPCVQAVARDLAGDYDCLTFHATGTGGQSMEKLADSGMLSGVIDVSTTEVADLIGGGVFSAGEDRLGAFIRQSIPYVGSCGALDMVNFHAMDTVPARFRGRNLYRHNPQVTLMRTTPEENTAIGRWIGERLNQFRGPVRFFIPEGGVSLLDAPGKQFWDPAADQALFQAVEQAFRPTGNKRLIKLPHNINDPEFSRALVEAFREIMSEQQTGGRRYAAV